MKFRKSTIETFMGGVFTLHARRNDRAGIRKTAMIKQKRFACRRVLAGKCVHCGKAHTRGTYYCQDCQDKNTERNKLRIEERKKAGLCVRCSRKNNSEKGFRCKKCCRRDDQYRAERQLHLEGKRK